MRIDGGAGAAFDDPRDFMPRPLFLSLTVLFVYFTTLLWLRDLCDQNLTVVFDDMPRVVDEKTYPGRVRETQTVAWNRSSTLQTANAGGDRGAEWFEQK
jgi:hypothetical protein